MEGNRNRAKITSLPNLGYDSRLHGETGLPTELAAESASHGDHAAFPPLPEVFAYCIISTGS